MPTTADLLSIIESGINAVRPAVLFPEILANPSAEIRTWLSAPQRFLLALGKASIDSAKTILSQADCDDYFVLAPYKDPENLLTVHVGNHPLPDATSFQSTRRLIDWLHKLPKEGSLLVVISGGTSALCVSPLSTIDVDSKMKVNELLIGSGATIQEINTVRKHLSSAKGGQLGAHFPAKKTHVLVISDVIGDDLSSIGSGPFFADPTTFLDAKNVLLAYSLWNRIPDNVRSTIEAGINGLIPETPKPGMLDIAHRIIASNKIAKHAAAEQAGRLGYSVIEREEPVQGDVELAVVMLLQEINRCPKGSALICGGEVTIRLTGAGSGGRNQHLALLMTEKINGSDLLFAAAGTDGIDGNSSAAGAWTDGETWNRASGFDHFKNALKNCDSYSYFKSIAQNIVTGPTGTNVMDLYIALT